MKKLFLVCFFVRVSLFFCSHGETIDPSEIDQMERICRQNKSERNRSQSDQMETDPFLTQIKSVGEDEIDLGILNPRDIDLGSRKFYRYIGSLTVPPCIEGVMTVSREQVHALRTAVHDGFEYNAKPLQKSINRPVFLFNPVKKED